MWDREERKQIDVIKEILETYKLEDILEQSDISPEEALYILFIEGYIEFPEARPVS
jgi:hypothetical protein